jgi:peptide/nickel transport system substrate-binding protein
MNFLLNRRLVIGLGLGAALLATTAIPQAMAAPKGNLNVAMSTFSEETFLPWNGSTGRKFYLDTIYEYLVYLDPKTLKVQPGLAESWNMSQDGKTFTFHIRKGVQFQNNQGELTAEDVKYTLDRLRDSKAIAGPSSPLRANVASTEAPDKYTFVVKLKDPDIDFVSGYLSNGLIVPIVCKKYVEEKGDDAANAAPVGTGPYQLVEDKKGSSIKVKVIPDIAHHWRNKNPAFETITFLSVPEEATRVAMLKTGEADLAPIEYDSIEQAKKSGLQVLSVKDTWAPVIRMGGLTTKFPNNNVPWAKEKVRQALNYAIDKDEIVKTIFHGEATAAGTDFPAPEFEAIKPYPYDAKKAKALLAEAGYPNGFNVTIRAFTTVPGAELPIIAQAVALYWQAIGVKAEVVPTDWPSLRGAWTSGKATDIVWTHRGFAFPSTLAGIDAGKNGASLFSSFSNAESDGKITEIRNTLDPAKRADLTKKYGQWLHDTGADIFIAWANEPYGASKKVGTWPSLAAQVTNIDLITAGSGK